MSDYQREDYNPSPRWTFGDTIIVLLLGWLLVLAVTGCQTPTLAPGGSYAQAGQQPDLALYTADAAFASAYGTLDFAFKFERDNRAMLWRISPNIKHRLDAVRPVAQQAVLRWAAARKAYLLKPVPANLTTLQTILADTERLAATVTAALPK